MCLFLCFISNKMRDFFKNMFNSKTVKITSIVFMHTQINLMSTNISIFIKIYYICSILYILRPIIFILNSIKPRFILITFLYFNISQRILFPCLFPYLALNIPFPVNIFPNKLVHEVPNNIPKSPLFCSFFFHFKLC